MEGAQDAQIFVSYSHKDREWLDRFLTMLRPYVEKNGISIWSDSEIRPGSRWRGEISDALGSARVAVLLVSPDFLASKFIQEQELPALLSAERAGRASIQWIAVRPSLYAETPIGEFQALNDPSTPLATLDASKVEDELVKVCYRLKRVLVEGRHAAAVGGQARGETLDHRSAARMVQEKLLELDRARRERDAALAKQYQESLKLVENKSLPTELIVGHVVLMLRDRVEEHLKYDVTLLGTIEALRNAGLDPRIYDLPSFDDALQQFRQRRAQYNQSAGSHERLRASIEEMITTPIRNIR